MVANAFCPTTKKPDTATRVLHTPLPPPRELHIKVVKDIGENKSNWCGNQTSQSEKDAVVSRMPFANT